MKLSYQGIQDKQGYAAAQVALPQYDWAKMAEKTAEKPVWVHFGAGNIFRGFIAGLQQRLLNAGLAESGIVAAETFDYDIIDKIIKLHDSPANTVCLCTGSLGCSPDNDIPSIIRHFGEMNRIGAMHVRNIKFLGYHHFREAAHLSEAGDLNMFDIMEAIYDTCPDTYIRPDHGRMIWDEKGRPGYGLYDRALGIAYLNGLWEALDKGQKR